MDATLDWQDRTPAESAAMFARFQDELPDRLEAAAEEIVLRIEADAARSVRVDTGRLRASIDHVVERVAEAVIRGSVGSNVEYAPFVEWDYPYLRPAVEANRPFIEDRVTQAVEAAWEAAH